jgi:hypothetical protein
MTTNCRRLRVVAAISLLLALGGCVIVPDGPYYHPYYHHYW